MKWMIVTDSSCDLMTAETGSSDVIYDSVPFLLTLDGKDYSDDAALDVPAMVDAMEASKASHSACPGPGAWAEKFVQADQVIAITISSNLSGSYGSAMVAKDMVQEAYPEKKIEVIDSRSTGPKLVMIAQHAIREISRQTSFDRVCESCRELSKNVKTIFTLTSFHNLVQNGRVSRIAGFLATKFGIRVLGVGTEEGLIHFQGLVRGDKKALRSILNSMEENGYNGKQMAISNCLNPQMAEELKRLILEKWHQAIVQILPTRGLDSYYAERNGLIVSYPVRTASL